MEKYKRHRLPAHLHIAPIRSAKMFFKHIKILFQTACVHDQNLCWLKWGKQDAMVNARENNEEVLLSQS